MKFYAVIHELIDSIGPVVVCKDCLEQERLWVFSKHEYVGTVGVCTICGPNTHRDWVDTYAKEV